MLPPDETFQCPDCGLAMTVKARGNDVMVIHAPCPGCGAEIVVERLPGMPPRVRIFEPHPASAAAASADGGGRWKGILLGTGVLALGAVAVVAWSHFHKEPPPSSPVSPMAVAPASAPPAAVPSAPVPPPPPRAKIVTEPPGETASSTGVPSAAPAASAPAPVPAPPARPAVVTNETTPGAPPRASAVSSSLTGPPRAALENFLLAANWSERLKYSQNPGKIGPLMREYYKTHRDGPVKADNITLIESDTVPDTNRRLHLYLIGIPALDADLPVSVEETADGYRVDWQTFIEGFDGRLDSFCSAYRPEPGDFRVSLRRTHYFGDPEPWQKDALCFLVDGPAPGEPRTVWVPPTSPLVRGKLKNGERLGWDIISHPVARLQWRKEKNGTEWIELVDLPADSWRSDSQP